MSDTEDVVDNNNTTAPVDHHHMEEAEDDDDIMVMDQSNDNENNEHKKKSKECKKKHHKKKHHHKRRDEDRDNAPQAKADEGEDDEEEKKIVTKKQKTSHKTTPTQQQQAPAPKKLTSANNKAITSYLSKENERKSQPPSSTTSSTTAAISSTHVSDEEEDQEQEEEEEEEDEQAEEDDWFDDEAEEVEEDEDDWGDKNNNNGKNNVDKNNKGYITMTESDPIFMSVMRESDINLANLMLPFRVDEINQYSHADLYIQLETLERMWRIQPEYHNDPRAMLQMTRRNLRLPLTGNLDPAKIEQAAEAYSYFITKALSLRFVNAGLINSENYPGSRDNERRFSRLFDMQYHAIVGLYSDMRYKALDSDEGKFDIPKTLGLLKFSTQSDRKNLTAFQTALFAVLRKLHVQQYRRYEKDVYAPIYTQEGHYTYAWKKIDTIEDYVPNCFNMNTEMDDFLDIVPNYSVCRDVAKFLCHLNCAEFPQLEFNRNLFAFRNGIYYLRKDLFFTYEDARGIAEMQHSVSSAPSNIKAASNTERKQLTPHLTACNYFDVEFQNWKEEGNIKKRAYPPEIQSKIAKAKTRAQRLSEVQGQDVPWKSQLDSDIRASMEEFDVQEEQRRWVSRQWTDIHTPAFESIFNAQEFSREIKWWIYALTGMALYSGGELDNWQVAVLVLGYAGTGKSTWLRLIREFYKLENVGILSNNIERQWALSSIYNKYVVLGYEVKKDFKWEQGEFQNCVTHEEVSIMVKHKTAFAHPFLAPIFMAGNEMITEWQDNSGSLARRLIVIYFRHFVKSTDPKLHNKLLLELPDLLQKFNRAYLEAVVRFGNKDIWKCLPPQFKEWSDEAMQSSNPLFGFIKQGTNELFSIEPENDSAYCSFKDFKDAYRLWCHREGYNSRVQWTRDFYSSIFDRQKIKVEKGTERTDNDRRVKKDWLVGICLNPDWRTKLESAYSKGNNNANVAVTK